jgi:hypothetical protein
VVWVIKLLPSIFLIGSTIEGNVSPPYIGIYGLVLYEPDS